MFSIIARMALKTVKEYAEIIGKSIPLIYKQIGQNKVNYVRKFGRYLIIVEDNDLEVLHVEKSLK